MCADSLARSGEKDGAIAALMTLRNAMLDALRVRQVSGEVWIEAVGTMLKLLAPIAPHISEELWDRLQDKFHSWHDHKLLLSELPWPECEESYLVTDEVEMVVQVNGKLRDKIN